MMERRVVVTGLGVVSSIGIGRIEFWDNLIEGKSGITPITLFDTSKFSRHNGGEVKNFNPADFIPTKLVKFFGRASQFVIAAAKQALEDASFNIRELRNRRTAVIIGVTMPEDRLIDFSSDMLLTRQPDNITKKILLNLFAPAIARNLGYFFRLKGENMLIPCACAAANYAVGYGLDLIKKGNVDLAIVGGAESLSRLAFQGFQRLYAMSPDKCMPFDNDRKGMMLGEGAGVLILEEVEHALKRGVSSYAYVLGYGISSDAYHITIPKQEGVRKAMEKALSNSGVSARDIDYISAHGTGTKANDQAEAGAIKELFGERYKKIPVSSIKSMLGHCMGASPALESIVCCLSINNKVVPPTINYTTPDPECDIDCVPNKARKVEVKTALNNSFAFGGNNCCVVFSSVK